MKNSLKEFVKSNVPFLFFFLSDIKRFIYSILVNRQKKILPKMIEKTYEGNNEASEIILYVKKFGIDMIPYLYTNNYKSLKITISRIDDLWVADVNNRKIYFPGDMSKRYVEDSVRVGLVEQDKMSPHRYLPTDEISIGGDVAILCGASDGIYTLEISHLFNKIYLFEADPRWVRPLKLTLRDILHKVEIVPLYISHKDSEGCITIDSFLREKEGEVNYLQADIENAELSMLMGATNLLVKAKNLKMSICCYHTEHQESELATYLKKFGFSVSTSIGYLLLWMQYPLKHPYLRRGVLYAQRINSK